MKNEKEKILPVVPTFGKEGKKGTLKIALPLPSSGQKYHDIIKSGIQKMGRIECVMHPIT
jgi:hypothetical protein